MDILTVISKRAIFLIILMYLVGCASPASAPTSTAMPVPTDTPVPTPFPEPSTATQTPAGKLIEQGEDIVGIWQIDHPDWDPAYMIIRSDGTYTFTPHTDGSRPTQSGKYWFEGTTFNILNDFCGKPGKYIVRRNDLSGQPSTLSFVMVEDDCVEQVRILTGQPPVQVEP